MLKHQQNISNFMIAARQNVPSSPTIPSYKTRELRAKLLLEECFEAIESLGIKMFPVDDDCLGADGINFHPLDPYEDKVDLVNLAKELADISVVTYGCACACGIDMEPVLDEVDRNNADKVKNGTFREDGKLIKSPDHWKCDIKSLIDIQMPKTLNDNISQLTLKVNKDYTLLSSAGWEVECDSPFEIRHKDGSFARDQAAKIVLEHIKNTNVNWADL